MEFVALRIVPMCAQPLEFGKILARKSRAVRGERCKFEESFMKFGERFRLKDVNEDVWRMRFERQ